MSAARAAGGVAMGGVRRPVLGLGRSQLGVDLVRRDLDLVVDLVRQVRRGEKQRARKADRAMPVARGERRPRAAELAQEIARLSWSGWG